MNWDLQVTMKLRFVEREEEVQPSGEVAKVHRVRVLQQWFEPVFAHQTGEWRDVPLESA
jgi:hypothetical protein